MSDNVPLEKVLFDAVQPLLNNKTLWVAYSGGIDSSVLLHALASIQSKLDCSVGAIHVNHKLQQESDQWLEHCNAVCNNLNINFKSVILDEKPKSGESVEAWAREQRYRAFSTVCHKGDLVLSAQHQDDQAETLLLQLIRGAGPQGLSAMPKSKTQYNYILLRPFLNIDRTQIEQYALENKIEWVNDVSNDDENYDRNYLRKNIFPALKQRWPSVTKTFSRSSVHIASMLEVLKNKTQTELESLLQQNHDVIDINALTRFCDSEQKNLLRAWIEHNNFILPSESILEQILMSVIDCGVDKSPLVCWQEVEVRRYKDKLYIMSSLKNLDLTPKEWNLTESLQLRGSVLRARLESGTGIKKELLNTNKVYINYREGGEKIKPLSRHHNHELKKLFQEAEVLPWVRDKIPLIYLDDKLIAVAGLWISDFAACLPNEEGWNIVWDSDFRLKAIDN